MRWNGGRPDDDVMKLPLDDAINETGVDDCILALPPDVSSRRHIVRDVEGCVSSINGRLTPVNLKKLDMLMKDQEWVEPEVRSPLVIKISSTNFSIEGVIVDRDDAELLKRRRMDRLHREADFENARRDRKARQKRQVKEIREWVKNGGVDDMPDSAQKTLRNALRHAKNECPSDERFQVLSEHLDG